jgi:archaellum component FlaF (FlaF/FlaG flagellin family)
MRARFTGCLFGVLICAQAIAQVTRRVSTDATGGEGNGDSYRPSLSVDGHFLAFHSDASDLVPGDTNGLRDIFVHDRTTGTTERVSLDSAGGQADGDSFYPSISADGRWTVFWSYATNLVPGDTNGFVDVFLHDRLSGATERVNVSSTEAQANQDSGSSFAISADGRWVAFESFATNLIFSDTNGRTDAFVRDRVNGVTERVSVDSSGMQANGDSYPTSLSAEGRYVAFWSQADNLVPGDTNKVADVFVRDRQNDTTERVSVDSTGAQSNGFSSIASITADGRYVAFDSEASNLVPGDTNARVDVFVHDRLTGATERVSLSSSGAQGDEHSYIPCISADGRFVVLFSLATNLVPADTNDTGDVFLHDRQTGTTERVSVATNGAQGNSLSSGSTTSVSVDGRFVTFDSAAPNLVAGDTNGLLDVFVRDRDAAGFTSLCDPGNGDVIACPCSNPPSEKLRGCDNSAATGGASLTASGAAYVSSDDLVFTTSGEKPTATSILLQGDVSVPAGVVYGQGVRCVGGVLRRLFTKIASGGSITAPDFAALDPTITERSGSLGDPILPGESRWYLVFYRDAVVLGGCPPISTFNSTQTGRIEWSP